MPAPKSLNEKWLRSVADLCVCEFATIRATQTGLLRPFRPPPYSGGSCILSYGPGGVGGGRAWGVGLSPHRTQAAALPIRVLSVSCPPRFAPHAPLPPACRRTHHPIASFTTANAVPSITVYPLLPPRCTQFSAARQTTRCRLVIRKSKFYDRGGTRT